MSIPINNVGPSQASQPIQNQATAKDVDNAKSLLEQSAKVLEDANIGESYQAASRKSPNDKSGQADATQTTAEMTKAAETLAATKAAIETEEDLKKKIDKKKKTPLDEKLEQLESLEGLIDEKAVEKEEDKNIIKEFFSNLTRLKNMRGRLKQLEKEESYYEELLKQEEERKRKEKRQ